VTPEISPDPHPAEFNGLYRSDAVELAATVFGRTFAGATLADPVRDPLLVDRVVAELGGVDLYSGIFGMARSELWNQVQPYSLEVISLWQQALVAAPRTTGGKYSESYVVLLRRGEQLLAASDPRSALQGFLPGSQLR
jgi:hypothetical protein